MIRNIMLETFIGWITATNEYLSRDRFRMGFRTGLLCLVSAIAFCSYGFPESIAVAQAPWRENAVQGQAVPRDVREMYEKGLTWLEKNQDNTGRWTGSGGDAGPGVTGLCLMTFLAYGEDPNFGAYNPTVRKAVQAIIADQNAKTGYIGTSMYHHGFAMLALAEA